MEISIRYSSIFYRKVKKFLKKFPELSSDLEDFEASLLNNPTQGESLGKGLYKVRLASKGKGKSGGFRIINYLISKNQEELFITVVTIYDKSEADSIDKSLLLTMLKELDTE